MGSSFSYGVGNGVAVRVRLRGGLGVPATAKMSTNFHIASMV